jgi:hypothetical protein
LFYEQFEKNRDYQIRNQVFELLHKENIDTTSAVDISKIISRMGEPITWEFVDLDGLPGFTCFNRINRKYKLFLDRETSEHCLERTIFTMAHELGHIVLRHFGSYNNSAYIINRRFETEANTFADELLMPTKPILARKMTVEDIINTYLVSRSAATNKLHYISRNTFYREDKQVCATLYTIIDRIALCPNSNLFKEAWQTDPNKEQFEVDGIDFSRDRDAYNERIINNCLEKWLEPC